MKYYLGIDGGNSKTVAVIADEGGVEIARARTGNGNHQAGRERAERNLMSVVNEVLSHAGLGRDDISSAVYGLAGADREFDYNILRPMVRGLGVIKHDVVCDTHIALRAGTYLPYGIVLICGAGTNALGVDPDGRALQCGGFGYIYGDFGGGGDLARELFRRVVRAWQGRGPQTLLTQKLLDKLGYPDVEAMYNDYLDNDSHPPASLAPLLFEVADEDEVARSILAYQGKELGLAAAACAKGLCMEGLEFDVVLAGSVIQRGDASGKYVRPHIANELRDIAPKARLRVLDSEPVLGAVLLAMELDGVKITSEIHDKLMKTLAV